MRILIGPVEVAGIAAGLKAGFDRIGVESQLVFSQSHAFGYGSGEAAPFTARVWRRLGDRYVSAGRSGSRLAPAWLLIWKAWALWLLAWALWRFDAFIFLFGNTLTNTRFEAWLHGRLGSKVVIVYCGADARPPYIDGQVFHDPKFEEPEALERLAARISGRVALHERFGFTAVNSPFTAHFHSKPVVSWFAMGVPSSAAPAGADAQRPAEGPVRALHSPSNPAVKGTARIVEIVEEVKRRGHSVELILLRNVPNDRVFDEIANADFVIDQLYSDTPMAAFAAEAAHCGKAVLVAGYSAEEFASVARAAAPPTLYVRPEDAAEAVERLVVDADLRRRLGAEARAFMQSDWSPEAVARRYLRLLTVGAPPEWLIEPDSVLYLHGGGMGEDEVRRSLARLIEARGAGALRLDHKPALRDAFVAFAHSQG
jgi:glycosyltransferase involved in cell wall biosynthesis